MIHRDRRAFTSIELPAIAIIAVWISLFLPAVQARLLGGDSG